MSENYDCELSFLNSHRLYIDDKFLVEQHISGYDTALLHRNSFLREGGWWEKVGMTFMLIIIPTLVCMIFGTVIPTSLNNNIIYHNCFFLLVLFCVVTRVWKV